jgi:hypothetical protein
MSLALVGYRLWENGWAGDIAATIRMGDCVFRIRRSGFVWTSSMEAFASDDENTYMTDKGRLVGSGLASGWHFVFTAEFDS